MNSEQQYEMTVSKRALDEVQGKLVENVQRLDELPARPANFRPLVGSYHRVANEATRRNAAQINSGFLDYLYAPEPVKATVQNGATP